MNKAHLPLFLAGLLSLLGFTQSAFATTLFGINFDFRYDNGENAGGYAGGGFISFEVDPDALPFDQLIDLNTVNMTQANFWLNSLSGDQARIWTLDDIRFVDRAKTISWQADVTIADMNPIFPVTFTDKGFNSLTPMIVQFSSTAHDILLNIEQSGEIRTTSTSTGGFPTGYPVTVSWTAGAWFDDPIPASVVPVPAAVWLFGSGLLGLIGVARRKKA